MQEDNLTQREKYLLKKQKKDQEQTSLQRKKTIKKALLIALPAFFVIGGIALGSKYVFPEQKPDIAGTPKIELNPIEFDVGDISMAQGLVTKVYEVKNAGSGSLKIDNIWTSCACTSAVLKVGDNVSPKFSMPGHGSNPVLWSKTLNPGEQGELEVVFDPNFHGDVMGPIVRVIYLSTNDEQNKTAEVRLLGNVVR